MDGRKEGKHSWLWINLSDQLQLLHWTWTACLTDRDTAPGRNSGSDLRITLSCYSLKRLVLHLNSQTMYNNIVFVTETSRTYICYLPKLPPISSMTNPVTWSESGNQWWPQLQEYFNSNIINVFSTNVFAYCSISWNGSCMVFCNNPMEVIATVNW